MKTRLPLPLPPEPVDPERNVGKMVKSALVMLVLATGLLTLVWFYLHGIEDVAKEEEVVNAGLHAVAVDLWLKGSAREISVPDVKLMQALSRIKKELALTPQIVVMPADPAFGDLQATHELLYSSGKDKILLVRVRFVRETQTLQILSFAVSEKYEHVMQGLRDVPEVPTEPGMPDTEAPTGAPAEELPEEPAADAPEPEKIPEVP